MKQMVDYVANAANPKLCGKTPQLHNHIVTVALGMRDCKHLCLLQTVFVVIE